jgi:aminoglycoside/choline kinase family phosphotransferase
VGFEMDYFLKYATDGDPSPGLRMAARTVVRRVAALPRILCLRDYQSQNLMVDDRGRLRLLDYQDALLAPAELDLAAFLHDSYLDIEPGVRTSLLEAYERERGTRVDPASLALLIVQRKCKDFARFRHLVARGELRFEPYEERARQAVLEALPGAAAPLTDALPALRRALEGDAA